MKFRISTCMAGIALLAAFAIAPVRLTSQTAQAMYKIVPLDTLGGTQGAGTGTCPIIRASGITSVDRYSEEKISTNDKELNLSKI